MGGVNGPAFFFSRQFSHHRREKSCRTRLASRLFYARSDIFFASFQPSAEFYGARFAQFRRISSQIEDLLTSFCEFSKCKGRLHGISARFQNAKAVHMEFLRIVGAQKASTRNFCAFSKCKSRPHGIFGNCWSAKAVYTEFLRIFKVQRAFTRNFCALLECKRLPHAVFARCWTAKAFPHGIFARFVANQRFAYEFLPRKNSRHVKNKRRAFLRDKKRRCI